MKKILLATLASVVLASCASDKGPVDENKFKVTKQPVKKNDDGKNVAPFLPSAPEECVAINGKFKRPSTKKEGPTVIDLSFDEMEIATKREGDKNSYSYNGQAIVADGEATEKDGTKTIAVCNKTGFEVTFVKEDKVSRVRFTQAADAKSVTIAVDSADEKVKSLAGTFTRVEEAAKPAPVTCPEGQELKDGKCEPKEAAPAGEETL